MTRAKLLKLIPLSLGIALLSGCSTIPIPFTATPSQASERKEEEDKARYIPKAISHTEIQISEQKTSNLEQEIEDTRDYLEFQQRYNPVAEGIVNALKQSRFGEVETRVKSLAARLEQDSSPYARQHLVRVKNFSYIVYEAKKVTEKISSKNVHPIITPVATATSASMVGFALAADAFGLLFVTFDKFGGGESQYFEATRNTVDEVTTGSMSPLFEETNKTLEELRFRKIKVYPYTGEKVVLETDIPGSRLEQELKAIKSKYIQTQVTPERSSSSAKELLREYQQRFREIKRKKDQGANYLYNDAISKLKTLSWEIHKTYKESTTYKNELRQLYSEVYNELNGTFLKKICSVSIPKLSRNQYSRWRKKTRDETFEFHVTANEVTVAMVVSRRGYTGAKTYIYLDRGVIRKVYKPRNSPGYEFEYIPSYSSGTLNIYKLIYNREEGRKL